MIRNLKIHLAGAIVLAGLGVIAVSEAHAAEFHCSIAECRFTSKPDGTGKAAHHVFIVENEATTESVSFTCESLKGSARTGKSSTELTITEITYPNCSINGSPGASIDMTGCSYLFTASEMHTTCPTGKHVDINGVGDCVFTLFPGRFGKVAYNTVGTTPNREITLSFNHVTVPEIGTDNCGSLIHSTALVGTYTTGNTLLTGETEAGVMADAWFE